MSVSLETLVQDVELFTDPARLVLQAVHDSGGRYGLSGGGDVFRDTLWCAEQRLLPLPYGIPLRSGLRQCNDVMVSIRVAHPSFIAPFACSRLPILCSLFTRSKAIEGKVACSFLPWLAFPFENKICPDNEEWLP